MKLSIDGALAKRILTLAGPVVAAMISQTLINNVDHILVGKLPPEQSVPGQAAVQFSLTLLWAVGGALSAIGVGTQALTARRFGSGDVNGAGKVLANSIALAASLGFVASLVFAYLSPHILPLISKDEAVLREGIPFLRYRYLAVMSMVVTASYKAFFDGLGHTYVHFAVALRYTDNDPAPVVVAKGAGPIAQRIKAEAAEHKIPMVIWIRILRVLPMM